MDAMLYSIQFCHQKIVFMFGLLAQMKTDIIYKEDLTREGSASKFHINSRDGKILFYLLKCESIPTENITLLRTTS